MEVSVDEIIQQILEITTKIMHKGNQLEKKVIKPIYTSTCEYFKGENIPRVKQWEFYNKVVMHQDELAAATTEMMDYHGNFRMEFMKIHDLIAEIGNTYDIFNQSGKRKIDDINGRHGHGRFDKRDRQSGLHSLLVKLRAT
jgi:hypothetical protein